MLGLERCRAARHDGTEESSSTAVLVSGVTGATAVGAGFDHSCAVIEGGQVTCWGNNEYGQLGVDTSADWSSEPVLVTGVTGATAVSAGEDPRVP